VPPRVLVGADAVAPGAEAVVAAAEVEAAGLAPKRPNPPDEAAAVVVAGAAVVDAVVAVGAVDWAVFVFRLNIGAVAGLDMSAGAVVVGLAPKRVPDGALEAGAPLENKDGVAAAELAAGAAVLNNEKPPLALAG
jgi:hypothetical protein